MAFGDKRFGKQGDELFANAMRMKSGQSEGEQMKTFQSIPFEAFVFQLILEEDDRVKQIFYNLRVNDCFSFHQDFDNLNCLNYNPCNKLPGIEGFLINFA